jgi:uncharacterized protein
MRRVLILLFLLIPFSFLSAQQATPPLTVTIDSKALNETRTILIRTPASYGTGQRKYPVVYMTDGDRHLPHTAATVDFLTREGRMPEVILVGISNTDRTRDLTPTHLAETNLDGQTLRFPTSGGADKFLSFIESELIPYVEKNYRTQPFRVFAGHSFGGLFAMHVFTSRPELFGGIIAVTPTLNWDNDWVYGRTAALVKNKRELNGTLVLTIGNEGEALDREFARFKKLMQSSAPKGLEWEAIRYEDEDHGSVVLPSHYAGLRKVFAPWRFALPRTADPTTLLSSAREHYASLSKRIGYTVPIPEPTTNLIGYRLLQAQRLPDAITAFKANVDTFPNSPNAYDSLGEAYETSGDLAAARSNYERAATLGKANGDANTNIYQQNLDRVTKALDTAKPASKT